MRKVFYINNYLYRARKGRLRERRQASVAHFQVPQPQQWPSQWGQQSCGRSQEQGKLRPSCCQGGARLSQGEGLHSGSSQSALTAPGVGLLIRKIWRGLFKQDGEETATPTPSQTRQVPVEELASWRRGQSGRPCGGVAGLSGTERHQRPYTEVSVCTCLLLNVAGRVCVGVSVTFWRRVIFGLFLFRLCSPLFVLEVSVALAWLQSFVCMSSSAPSALPVPRAVSSS